MRIRDLTDTVGANACYGNFCTIGTSLASADLSALVAAQFGRMVLDASKSVLANKLEERARNLKKIKVTIKAILPNGMAAVLYLPDESTYHNNVDIENSTTSG